MKKLLFYGDSITDCHKSKENPLGEGYVKILSDMLDDILINQGISGNTSRDLVKRLHQDVLTQDVDEVYIMIGINDVWQRFKNEYAGNWIYPSEYKENLEYMIQKIQEKEIPIILVSPFYLDLNHEDEMRKCANSYRNIMQGVSHEFGLKYIDVQAVFDDYLEEHDVKSISDDKIHVNRNGNKIIADTIYRALQ